MGRLPPTAILGSRAIAGSRIYLDHAATTPISPAARAAMTDALGRWANPSSPHAEGRAARAALEGARAAIADALGWRHDILFTSGATEAIAIALRPAARPVLASAIEHLAVLRARPDATIVPVGADGLVDPAALGAAMRTHPGALIAVQHANSETGILQPIAEMIEVTDLAGGVLMVDCAQTAGKIALPQADLMVVSAHKLGGPPGIGALLVRDLGLLTPSKGGQEQGYRLGTENLPAILGFAAALADAPLVDGVAPWMRPMLDWRVRLDDAIMAGGGTLIGGHAARKPAKLPTIASYRMPGVAAAVQLIRLDMAGIAVSAGSACSSGSLKASHVLTAMGLDDRAAGEVIRVSFGATTVWDDVERFAAAWRAIAADLGVAAP